MSQTSRQTMSAVTPGSPVSVPLTTGTPIRIAASQDARWVTSMRSWRARCAGVRPGMSRLTSVTMSVGTSTAPEAATASMAGSSASQACSTLSTPARADATTEADDWAWLMTRRPSRWASADDRPDLGLGQLGLAEHLDARCEAGRRQHGRRGRDDLDDIGAGGDALADGSRKGRLPLGLDPELVPVPARRTDRQAGGDEPGPGRVARGDGVAEPKVEVPDRAGAACARHAGSKGPFGMAGGRREDDVVGAGPDDAEVAFGRIERVVGVRVDEPRQERQAATVDDDRPARWRVTG